jgi:hypothetical protein
MLFVNVNQGAGNIVEPLTDVFEQGSCSVEKAGIVPVLACTNTLMTSSCRPFRNVSTTLYSDVGRPVQAWHSLDILAQPRQGNTPA